MRRLAAAMGALLVSSTLSALPGCGGALDEAGTDAAQGEEVEPRGDEEEGEEPAKAEAGELMLEECELGEHRDATSSCNWLAEDRCYETKPQACNCVCPRSGPSVCSSDFYGGEGSQTKVTCR